MPDPRPRNGSVFLRMVEEDEARGRIIVPQGSAPWPTRGIVLYVADDVDDLHPGDEVIFFTGNAVDIRIGDETLILIHESKILAVTDPAPVPY